MRRCGTRLRFVNMFIGGLNTRYFDNVQDNFFVKLSRLLSNGYCIPQKSLRSLMTHTATAVIVATFWRSTVN